MNNHHQSGFTLIEIIVVMFIIAIMCGFGYAGLNNTIKQSAQVENIRDELEGLQLAFSLLQQDLSQTVYRDIINEYGSEEHALLAEENSANFLKLTRVGWPNPAEQARSSMTRIEWLIDEDNNLVRRRWYELDRAPGSEPVDTIVLNNIESVEMQFLDEQDNWQPLWPNINNLGPGNAVPKLPRVAEISLNTKRWGEVRRAFNLVETPVIINPNSSAGAGSGGAGSGGSGGGGGAGGSGGSGGAGGGSGGGGINNPNCPDDDNPACDQ